ncbi:hypothetical protein WOLCODRAFT_163896 [Wolfiporia cocos MD-104 SS10]|uniref:Uncharacterized protein n=1 Tax=Wolfiporia cocos (strain MD-104) TaxID=742152 RepID=A0A2H3K2G0_WOLCO|nr:hypothetical protein WOLCODRAFT_163896 [Wolfiporia cocos MD-104 SS10]
MLSSHSILIHHIGMSVNNFSEIAHALTIRVPLAPYQTQQGSFQRCILFRYRDNGRVGIRLSDALACNTRGIERGNERLLLNTLGDYPEKVSLRVGWPGYPAWGRQIRARDSAQNPQPYTFAKLAEEIAKAIKQMIDENANRQCAERSQGWAVGPGRIQLEHLYLAEIHHVARGSIEPVLLRSPQSEYAP